MKVDLQKIANDNKPRLAVGVSVLLVQDRKILLGERINNTAGGLLSTPGGRVELEEDIYDTAIRELEEETGIVLTRDDFSVMCWREHFRYGDHYIMFYLRAHVKDVVPENREPNKCVGWYWYDPNFVRREVCTEPDEILSTVLR